MFLDVCLKKARQCSGMDGFFKNYKKCCVMCNVVKIGVT